MTQHLIMCRSLTHAQRSARLLERAGITATVYKAPAELSRAGCGYAVSIYRRVDEALRLLDKNNMIKGKIYRRRQDGAYEELAP